MFEGVQIIKPSDGLKKYQLILKVPTDPWLDRHCLIKFFLSSRFINTQ